VSNEEWDTSRLPKKWQRYVEARENEIRQLKRHVEELSAGPDDSDTFITDYAHPDRKLGKSPNVAYVLDTADPYGKIFARIEEHRGVNTLYIQGYGMSTFIQPLASNSFRVSLRDT